MAALPHRPPHRGPQINDRPPPSLPPRPGGRAVRPPPTALPSVDSDTDPDDYLEPDNKGNAPEEIYDDFSEDGDLPGSLDQVYDDCQDRPPALPPLPSSLPEEFYDDFEEQPKLPARPPAKLPPPPVQPLPAPPQETYDDLDNIGPVVVQQIPKVRQLPPMPAPPPPVELPPPSSNNQSDDIYEVDFDEQGMLSPPPPPPPPPPPKEQARTEIRLPPQPRPAAAPAPKPAPSSGGFSIDLGQLKDMRAGLRKVSIGSAQDSNNDPKTYGECTPSVADAKKKFQEKAVGKPGNVAPKPAIMPKFGTWKTAGSNSNHSTNSSASNTMSKPISHSSAPKPPPPSTHQKEDSSSSSSRAPDVTFLPKVNKDKHTNVPASQVPPPSKPVVKYQPPQVEDNFTECDDIYDDASSGDLLDRHDWYHGYLDRKQAEARVKGVGKDGTYLVRVSEKDPRFPYTLVVLNKGNISNLRIRKRADAKFALGDEKVDELTFLDVPTLIDHHKSHQVVLLGGGGQSHVVLQHTPRKS